MIYIVTRTLEWTIRKKPLARCSRPGKGSRSVILDALDLALTLRGHGWEWSHGVKIPHEYRPTDRRGFTLHVSRSAITHALVCGGLHKAIGSFDPTTIGAAGGSLYDDTLPFHTRHIRAGVMSLVAWAGIYTFIQFCYDICTLLAILFLGHDPEQWPPAFDAPWLATSISDFWGRRWHQFFRRLFLVQGGFPLQFFFGRTGLVFGAFFSSAVLHHVTMVILNDKLEAWRLLAGFTMFAPVVLAENAFMWWTGHKVEGFAGRIWAIAWFLVWGTMCADGFARAGMFGRLNFTELVLPENVRDIIEKLVTHLDGNLRAL